MIIEVDSDHFVNFFYNNTIILRRYGGESLRTAGVLVPDAPLHGARQRAAGQGTVQSKDEGIEWLKRAPFDDTEVEIRQAFETEDFGAELTPELREQEQRLRKQVADKTS